VIFDRRHRVLATFLYTLPFGKGDRQRTLDGYSGRRLAVGWRDGLPECGVSHRCPGVG
jgi:hypothetical protein